MFKQLRTAFDELLIDAEYNYELADKVIKEINKLEVRYNIYEKTLKKYANKNNWVYDNQFCSEEYIDGAGYELAVEALKKQKKNYMNKKLVD